MKLSSRQPFISYTGLIYILQKKKISWEPLHLFHAYIYAEMIDDGAESDDFVFCGGFVLTCCK